MTSQKDQKYIENDSNFESETKKINLNLDEEKSE
jgi:hypothetical protein